LSVIDMQLGRLKTSTGTSLKNYTGKSAPQLPNMDIAIDLQEQQNRSNDRLGSAEKSGGVLTGSAKVRHEEIMNEAGTATGDETLEESPSCNIGERKGTHGENSTEHIAGEPPSTKFLTDHSLTNRQVLKTSNTNPKAELESSKQSVPVISQHLANVSEA